MAEILIVDDERTIREGLKALFAGEGFSVRTARDGNDALAAFDDRRPDLVLLDVMMPKRNGFAVCEEIRARDPLVPVIFLTAKESDVDEVRGLGLGADDYIPKSASEHVLLARVKRAIARSAAGAGPEEDVRELRLGSVTVDFDQRVVSTAGGTELLTVSEAELLKCLLRKRGATVPTDDIRAFLRGKDFVCDPSAVRVHVMNLRKKLGPAGDMIGNTYKVGYYLVK